MRRATLIIALLLFVLNVSAQKTVMIQNILLSVNGDMISLYIPDNKEESTKIIEVNRIPNSSDIGKTGDKNKLKQIIRTTGTSCKTILTSGEYVFRVITQKQNKKELIQERRFFIK